jgi:hypothetical protein
VVAALSTVLLAAPQHAEKLLAARRVVAAHAGKQMVIALISSGSRSSGTFGGLYAVAADAAATVLDARAVMAVRVFGSGPSVLTPAMVHTLFKFDTAAREFKAVSTNATFTITTDAVGIDSVHVVVSVAGDGKIRLVGRDNASEAPHAHAPVPAPAVPGAASRLAPAGGAASGAHAAAGASVAHEAPSSEAAAASGSDRASGFVSAVSHSRSCAGSGGGSGSGSASLSASGGGSSPANSLPVGGDGDDNALPRVASRNASNDV